jgi:hypothetical protein
VAFFSALSPESDADKYDIIDEKKSSRDRFDTNEHMELLGEGKFGQGNTPVISKEKLNDQDVVKIIHKKKLKQILKMQDKVNKNLQNIKYESQLIL